MTLEDSKIAIPVISAIVERDTASGKEILIQTRIAKYDKLYQGTIEIPAGRIEAFENVKETIIREVKEETGLDVIKIIPDPSGKIYTTSRNDKSIVFNSYCCQQLLKGNIPWIGFVFVCKVKDGKLRPAEGETKDLRWIKLAELQDIIKNSPDSIFTLQLPVLDFYLKEHML